MSLPVTIKGQIIPEQSDVSEDYICSLTLNEDCVVIEADEYLKEKQGLYKISLDDIQYIDIFTPKEPKKNFFYKLFYSFFGIFILMFSKDGFTHQNTKPKILEMEFMQGQTHIKLVFKVPNYYGNKFIKIFNKLKTKQVHAS